MDHRELCALTNAALAEWDLGELNLAIATGLPSGTTWDVRECRDALNEWVDFVRRGTENSFRRFRHRYPDDSDAQFRILTLTTLLQRNLGARYNRTFMEGEYDGRDSCNLFIHGLLTGRGGSCVTMPVLTVAIGRRLGYPLRLVNAKLHTFCRWDDPSSGERFNIDATFGFGQHPDEYYLTWPARIRPEEIEYGYLQSLTPREEAAFFLGQRGTCCLDHLQFRRAVEAFHAAHLLHPSFPAYHHTW